MLINCVKWSAPLCLLFILNVGFAQKEIFVKNNQAIQGYDPVAYFKNLKPVKGRNEFSYNWKGENWYFATQKNLNDFKANPEKYAPQFGGYCAYGVADGHKAPTSPDAWTIFDGKLFLNYDRNMRDLWVKDMKGFIQQANKNWPAVKKEKD